MQHNGTRNARTLEQDDAGATIDEGLEEYRTAARAAFEGMRAGRAGSPQELAVATLEYHRAELELARETRRQVYASQNGRTLGAMDLVI